jgi:GSH-dependent disulfide-bond oxidoreductase
MQLFYFPTPNGHKITMALEEMALDYEIVLVNILEDEQNKPEFLKISPNARIPALVDYDASGQRVNIFESGAILQYLGRKSGQLYPSSEAGRAWVDAWVFWQMSGLGPMSGQVNWFVRVSKVPDRDPRDSDYPIKRYKKEVRRLYDVLERELAGKEYICGDYSIADIACWPWIDKYHANAGDLAEFPYISAWRDRVAARPAVQRAMTIGQNWGTKIREISSSSPFVKPPA